MSTRCSHSDRRATSNRKRRAKTDNKKATRELRTKGLYISKAQTQSYTEGWKEGTISVELASEDSSWQELLYLPHNRGAIASLPNHCRQSPGNILLCNWWNICLRSLAVLLWQLNNVITQGCVRVARVVEIVLFHFISLGFLWAFLLFSFSSFYYFPWEKEYVSCAGLFFFIQAVLSQSSKER